MTFTQLLGTKGLLKTCLIEADGLPHLDKVEYYVKDGRTFFNTGEIVGYKSFVLTK